MNASTRYSRTANPLRIADGHDDSLAASTGNLPLVLTSFVGREREISEVKELLSGTRLLTLVGPGGCGKTRLALRVAADLRNQEDPTRSFRDGVWWVSLSSLSDAGLVPNAVASALGISETPDRALTEALLAFLEAKGLLLVLDNCEHLVGACAGLADELLRSCPDLKVLATSREPLGVAGEVSWPVPPLSLPDSERGQAPEDLLRSESVRLFVERARATAPDFTLTEENASAVVGLCQRLDGMPLALELAAARVRMFSPAQILDRLDDRFRLLRGSRTATPRHKTLEAAIDWSHELLSEVEKVLFRRLSVFAGGFSLEGEEAVCAGEGIEDDEVLELLSGLVDKSLVVVHGPQGDKARYRMLQTIRQYASEKLRASGEAEAARRRHADFFLALAEEAEPAMMGPEQASWLARLEEEHDNLRAALGWLAGEEEAERGLRLAAALLRFWWFSGHLAEGCAQLEGLLDLCSVAPISDEVRAKALHVLGVAIYRHKDPAEDGWTVARSHLEEALGIYRRLEDEAHVADVLRDLGRVNSDLGDWTAARSFLDESLQIGRRLGDRSGIALSLFCQGVPHLLQGDFSPARAHFEEGLGIFQELEDKFWISASLVHLGYVDCEEGRHTAARSRFVEMNETVPLVQFPWGATYTLEGFARLAAAEGHMLRALRLGGATTALRRTYGVSIGPSRQAAFERGLEPVWQALGEKKGRAAWEEGRTTTLEGALDLALEEPAAKPDSSSESLLTAREAEVLSLVAEGLSDAQVAEKLYVSPRTVGGHLRGAYRKLGVTSRTAAIKKARELNLI